MTLFFSKSKYMTCTLLITYLISCGVCGNLSEQESWCQNGSMVVPSINNLCLIHKILKTQKTFLGLEVDLSTQSVFAIFMPNFHFLEDQV